MNFWVTYPLLAHPYNPEFLTKSGLTRFCVAAEEAGFAGIGFTDHPAPSDRWLKAGRARCRRSVRRLAFCAAVTDRMRLIPNILVLPYRNPFLVAKAAATLDALSGAGSPSPSPPVTCAVNTRRSESTSINAMRSSTRPLR
jgi:hypothetical protein